MGWSSDQNQIIFFNIADKATVVHKQKKKHTRSEVKKKKPSHHLNGFIFSFYWCKTSLCDTFNHGFQQMQEDFCMLGLHYDCHQKIEICTVANVKLTFTSAKF